MTLAFRLFLPLLLLCASCSKNIEKPKPTTAVHYLNSLHDSTKHEWEFNCRGKWYPATVPGNIHDDLLKNRLIPDPYFETNEDSVQWVSDSIWIYRLIFNAEWACSNDFNHQQLVFEGVDTYAEVYLNGKLLMPIQAENNRLMTVGRLKVPFCNNMFRKWSFDVSGNILKKQGNELIVKFLPSSSFEQAFAARSDCKLPDYRVFSRKAQYESGWDWGPKLITCGIWKNIYVESWRDFHLTDIYVDDRKPTWDTTGIWETSVEVNVESDKTQWIDFQVDFTDDCGQVCRAETKKKIGKGAHRVTVDVSIPHPKLWWPNGWGAAHLYEVMVTASSRTGRTHNMKPCRHGLRTIELKQKGDSIGESFEFVVNGHPLFVRGANWIPASSFPGEMNRAEGNDEYHQLLSDCRSVNMNMIRVWGGGIYENDSFYDNCDRLGLLVWQDFMFACNLYPADSFFLKNVQQEVTEQLKRLRNHACLAVFCGNNEVHNGLEDWGWKETLGYSDTQYRQRYQDYRKLFENLLPKLVKKYSAAIPYIHTSPTYGWGHPECCTHGCSHYWGVWWGEQPFDVWGAKTGRFMTEYGFQSYPETATIKGFTTPASRNFSSAAMKNHQKHGRGMEIIQKAMKENIGAIYGGNSPETITDMDKFACFSQLVQAEGIGKAIAAHRIRHEHCRGTLYWQLNDCWPVASWSSIDHEGRWKALHYRLKEHFANIAIFAENKIDQQSANIYIVNDSMKDIVGDLVLRLYATDGDRAKSEKTIARVTVPANQCKQVCCYDLKEVCRPDFHRGGISATARFHVLSIEFRVNGSVQAKKIVSFVPKGQLSLLNETDFPSSQLIRQNIRYFDDHFELALIASCYRYGVRITETSGRKIRYSDNYFELLPGEKKVVTGYYDTEQGSHLNLRVSSFGEYR